MVWKRVWAAVISRTATAIKSPFGRADRSPVHHKGVLMKAGQFAVFGHPISHSLSPQIHQAFARQFGLELAYRTIDASPDDFADAVRRFFAEEGARGANVTLPHKNAAYTLANVRSEAATRAGSANVLTLLPDGRIAAHNTDGAGAVRDLTERHQLDLRGHDALLLGAG